MENSQTPGTGLLAVINSLAFSVLTFLSIQSFQTIMAIVASSIAVVSGAFAIRFYYYATKEKKQAIKNLK